MAKAESAKEIGNLNEAAIFSAKVSELLTKYNLEKADLNTTEESDVGHADYDDLGITNSQGGWTSSLLNIICKFNYCKMITNSMGSTITHVTIIGAPENVEIAKYLYEILKGQFELIGKVEWKKYLSNTRKEIVLLKYFGETIDSNHVAYKKPWKYFKRVSARGKFLKSFYMGAVSGVHTKLQEANDEAKIEHGTKITDLMVLTDTTLEDYMNEIFDGVRNVKGRKKKVDMTAYRSGQEVGKNASMAKGVANNDSVATKMLS